MPYLSFVSDSDFEQAVQLMLDSATNGLADAEEDFSRNVIDPFSLFFEMSGFGIQTVADWEKSEKTRQAQKTLVQALGDFHQSVLGSIPGWTDLGVGNVVDLVHQSKPIIAEVKNKYNTVTGAKLVTVYDDLDALVMPRSSIYHGYTAYFVQVIPKRVSGYDQPFTPSDKATGTRRPSNPQIRVIDGKRFYALASGIDDALAQVYGALPAAIQSLKGSTFGTSELQKMKAYFTAAFG